MLPCHIVEFIIYMSARRNYDPDGASLAGDIHNNKQYFAAIADVAIGPAPHIYPSEFNSLQTRRICVINELICAG